MSSELTMDASKSNSGILMVELAMALAVLSVGLLAFLGSFFSNYRAFHTVNDLDEAHLALESAAETLRGEVFSDVYANYHGGSIPAPNLRQPNGQPANVQILCFVNEGALPLEFGPLAEIDGDPAVLNLDCSTSYRLLPVRLSLTYASRDGVQTRETYLVLSSG